MTATPPVTSARSPAAAASSDPNATRAAPRSARTSAVLIPSARTTASRSSSPATRIRQARCVPAAACTGSTVRPATRKTASSTISSSSMRMWLEMRIVRPSAASCRRSSRSCTRACGSSPDAGSSSSSTWGSWTRARASPSFCFCPRESTRAGTSARSAKVSRCSSSLARCSAAARGIPYRRPVTTSDSRAVSEGHAPSASGIQPTSRLASCGCVTGSTPPTRSSPSSGASSEASMSSRVVLPAPFGPTRPVIRPAWASNPTSRTAWTSPKERRTPLAAMPGAVIPSL